MIPGQKTKFFKLTCNIIVVFWTCYIFIWLNFSQWITVHSLFKKLLTTFYIPHHNVCIVGKYANINSYFYIYAILILSVMSIYLLRLIRPSLRNGLKSEPVLLKTTLLIVILTIGLQTLNQVNYFVSEIRTFSGKPLEQRYGFLLQVPFLYAQEAHEHLPSRHYSELITDLDMTKDPGMLIHRALAYFLYPIDIRVDLESPKDCLIVFHKKDAIKSVPEDYEILARVGEKYLLAKKKAFPNGD